MPNSVHLPRRVLMLAGAIVLALCWASTIAIAQSNITGMAQQLNRNESLSQSCEPTGQWTTDLLLQHIMRILDERHAQYNERFVASQQAIEKAETATRLRFDSVNEFRALVESMIDTLMKREEGLARFAQINQTNDQDRVNFNEQIRSLQTQLGARIENLSTQFLERIEAINSRLDRNEGSRAGMSSGWGYIVAAIGAAGVIIGIIFAVRRS